MEEAKTEQEPLPFGRPLNTLVLFSVQDFRHLLEAEGRQDQHNTSSDVISLIKSCLRFERVRRQCPPERRDATNAVVVKKILSSLHGSGKGCTNGLSTAAVDLGVKYRRLEYCKQKPRQN